jgi:H+/Cl- antiporter ClcA
VENLAVGSCGRTAATRGPGLFSFGAGDRRLDWVSGGRLHLADGTAGDAAVPGGRCSLATAAVPGRGLARHRFLLYRYFPNARGSGVPQTKAALFAREGRITLRTVLGKFFCTSATLASGIPLGREGPSVQVGAGIASVLGRFFGLRTEQVKMLIPVGTAAAIAAAFNTPLAAVLFALEEIVGDLHAPVLGAVVRRAECIRREPHLIGPRLTALRMRPARICKCRV